MGIRGLTSYVDSISSLWREIELQNTEVIVDGNALYHHLYTSSKLDYQSGGQYEEFHDITVSFFNSLKSNNVEAFVLLDGALDPSERKLATNVKRAENRILDADRLTSEPSDLDGVRPLLARRTFVQTMTEFGVKFAVCDCEADQEIASLANLWNCPVISNDSDFFIFDLKQGYIPLKHLDWSSEPLTADLFKSEKLSQHLKIPKDLLPLLASLLGNDYVSYEDLFEFHEAMKRVSQGINKTSRIANFLRSKANLLQKGLAPVLNLVQGEDDKKLQQALETSMQSYRDKGNNLASYFQGAIEGEIDSVLVAQSSSLPLEPWVVSKYREGLFPKACMNTLTVGKQFLRVQVENFSVLSANQCSLKLRQFMYGITRDEAAAAESQPEVQSASVEEWDRHGNELQNYQVQPCDHIEGFGQLPSLCTVPDLEIAERRRLCLMLLESNTNLILSLPAELQLFAASLRFWINHAQPAIKGSHLRALLICSLKLTEDEQLSDVGASKSRRHPHTQEFQPSFDLEAQHSFAQWQCVIQEAVHLNLVLQEPLHTPLIRHLYDGLLVQDLVWKLEKGQTAKTLLLSVDELKKFYKAVTHKTARKLMSSRVDKSASRKGCHII